MPIQARLPDRCSHEAPPPPVFDGRAWITVWVTTCSGGLEGGVIAIEGLERTSTDTLVRYELEPGKTQVHRLTSSETAFTVPEVSGVLDIMTSYIALGVTHILEGVDHLLFVFALLLLIRDRRRLLWAITAFTVAHSITLAAASLGWLNIPPSPVEAVIALSIVFLAYELSLAPEARDPMAERFPWVVAFAFGLIHGLGFAGALREIGLPEGDIPLALLSFNIGVELGQILFILLVLAIGAAARRLYPELRKQTGVFVRAASYGIGSLAAFWVIQRLSGL
jgi:hydrogenase/urease accessory protein HupE